MFGLARLARLDLDERLDEVGLGGRRAKGSANEVPGRHKAGRFGLALEGWIVPTLA